MGNAWSPVDLCTADRDFLEIIILAKSEVKDEVENNNTRLSNEQSRIRC